MSPQPYRASVGTRSGVVRPARADEDGKWTWELDGELVPIGHPGDFAASVPPGVEVTIDFGRFALTVWRTDAGHRCYRATAGAVRGPERADEELALWALLDQLGEAAAPRACFFCRWSEVEDGSGWGNLGCVSSKRAAYDRAAMHDDPRQRKSACLALLYLPPCWVDEWHCCDQFEVRPPDYGYRGRPKPARWGRPDEPEVLDGD